MPIRAIREKLRLIRYYSASRPYNRWSAALDIALAAGLLLAWPTTWLLDRSYVSRTAQQQISGMLFEAPDGAVRASVSPDALRGDLTFTGAFQVTVRSNQHGWPFVSSRRRPQARVGLELFAPRQSRPNADLPPDSPLRSAIADALRSADHDEAIPALAGGRGSQPDVSYRPRAWLANTIIWSILLPATAWIVVSASRSGWVLVESARRTHRQQRRHGANCVTCGYDLRASVFSDRCPECGAKLE
ncbi:MAG: hypothetical protein ACYS0G_03885 [Planctomycetota bacterium]|jgi:hypothetical protein